MGALMSDPFSSPYGHPQLPSGYNADDLNGDEFNGPGTNWPIWPLVFDTYQGFTPLIITDEMLEVFEGCADWIVPCPANLILMPTEGTWTTIGGTWPNITPPTMNNTIVFPHEVRELDIKQGNATITATGEDNLYAAPHEVDEQDIRRPS
jgi:hypothetical protein